MTTNSINSQNEHSQSVYKELFKFSSPSSIQPPPNMPQGYFDFAQAPDAAEYAFIFREAATDDDIENFAKVLNKIGLYAKTFQCDNDEIKVRSPPSRRNQSTLAQTSQKNQRRSQNKKLAPTIVVTASNYALSIVAEELKIRKRKTDGTIGTFRRSSMACFCRYPNLEIFEQSEQFMIINYIQSIIPPKEKTCKIGIENVKQNRDREMKRPPQVNEKSFVESEIQRGILECGFPLHDETKTSQVVAECTWKNIINSTANLKVLRDYFGDKVALYFAFLRYYTQQTLFWGVFGLITYVLSFFGNYAWAITAVTYTLFTSLWGSNLIETWKKENARFTLAWNSYLAGDNEDELLIRSFTKEEVRADYVILRESTPINSKSRYIYGNEYRLIRMIMSFTIVVTFAIGSIVILFLFMDIEDKNEEWVKEQIKENNPWLKYKAVQMIISKIWLVGLCLSNAILEVIYKKVAITLTKFQNYKRQMDYDNSLIAKLVIFFFISRNAHYLHGAFIRRDLTRVSSGLRNILVLEFLIGNARELLLPYIVRNSKSRKTWADPQLNRVWSQYALSSTNAEDDVFEDYFELTRQFIQISVFATAFPLGALLAGLNNVIECYTDSIKWTKEKRRPIPRRTLTIGSWIYCLDIISCVSVMTNLAIIVYTAKIGNDIFSQGNEGRGELYAGIFLEHLFLALRFLFVLVKRTSYRNGEDQKAVRHARYEDMQLATSTSKTATVQVIRDPLSVASRMTTASDGASAMNKPVAGVSSSDVSGATSSAPAEKDLVGANDVELESLKNRSCEKDASYGEKGDLDIRRVRSNIAKAKEALSKERILRRNLKNLSVGDNFEARKVEDLPDSVQSNQGSTRQMELISREKEELVMKDDGSDALVIYDKLGSTMVLVFFGLLLWRLLNNETSFVDVPY